MKSLFNLVGVLLAALALVLPLPAAGQQVPPPGGLAKPQAEAPAPLGLPFPARELVRRAIDNQIKADDARDVPRFRFVLRQESKKGVVTREHLETDEGIISRTLAINDQPLTPDQRQKDDARIAKLLASPELRRQKAREQQQDEERTRKIIDALPAAFLYAYDGTAPGKNGALVRLRFQPDPAYHPPSRELRVLQGMEGSMLVDPAAMRLVRIEGRLVRDVDFGWGLLGKLYKGGQFVVEQEDVGGLWKPTAMTLNFDGRAVIFKTIKVRNKQAATNFRRVPSHLSYADGVALLRNGAGAQAAATKPAGS